MKTNREEILQSALQLFMSMNYESVSLQMIAHSVGLTKTGIFNYYPSKLDLFIAVADRYLFHLQDPENKFAPSDGSLRDFIDKYVEGVEHTMAEIVRLGNIQREKMPGQLANAGYFHLFQQVLFYDRRSRNCRSVPAGIHRTLVPNVFLRRPRCRDSPKAFPLYIWAAEALSRLSAAFFTIRSKNMTTWSYFCFFMLSLSP